MKIIVNGRVRLIDPPTPLTSLLHVLREQLDVTGPKAGCQAGGCGTCTVLIDDQPRRSCLTPVVSVEGHKIRTVDGLADGIDLSPMQRAFHDNFASQCGFCTPGMLMAATALAERATQLVTREDVVAAIGGHVCRCTGFVKIIDAVLDGAARTTGDRG